MIQENMAKQLEWCSEALFNTLAEEEALKEGMEEKSKEFVKNSSEVYAKE